jgi:hypothetical protein
LTEKALRPIACGQPFILAATPGSLQYLRSYGFKTFSGYIDETYDTIQEMQNNNKELYIEHDYEFFSENTPKDHHPSKLCHRVIANNIINSIENDLK